MGAVVYLGAGWPQWKPLDIPGTHLPFSEAAGLLILRSNRYVTKVVPLFVHSNVKGNLLASTCSIVT